MTFENCRAFQRKYNDIQIKINFLMFFKNALNNDSNTFIKRSFREENMYITQNVRHSKASDKTS